MRNIISALMLTIWALLTPMLAHSAISGEWRAYPAFDNSAITVIDTPDRVYFTGYSHSIVPEIAVMSAPDCSLFFLDKDSDEIADAYTRYSMASPAVRYIEYNPYRKYLFVAYDDNNIDLLFDSGETANISALKNASIPGSKNIRFASFDRNKNLLWVATDFGYIAIDDKNFTVKESRNYNIPVDCVTSVGDNLLLAYNGYVYSAKVSDPRMSLSEFTLHSTTPEVKHIYPLDTNLFMLHANAASSDNMLQAYLINPDGTLTLKDEQQAYYSFSLAPCADGGYRSMGHNNCYSYVSKDGKSVTKSGLGRPADDHGKRAAGSWDGNEFFTLLPRQGLRSYKRTAPGSKEFNLTRAEALPNATPVCFSRAMASHPRFGALVSNIGLDACFNHNALQDEMNLSGLKNGEWTRYGFVYTNPEQGRVGYGPLGLAIDPQDDKYVYMGSRNSGMTRLNLEDPQDIIHYSFAKDPTSTLPGYVEANQVQEAWSSICPYSAPYFDADGNLWSFYFNYDQPVFEMQYLTPADRKATTSAANACPFRKLRASTKGATLSQQSLVKPLRSSVNRNYILYFDSDKILMLDHKGTIDNSSDDQVVILKDFTDQDGGRASLFQPGFIYEDESTGIVWLGSSAGIYYIQPRNIMQGQAVLNRVKVARNDGTSLADYLLSGVGVNGLTVDNSGRKWLGTIGAGIVVTSSDCKNIIAEFTAANSGLLSDNIYTLQYIPATNSVMISTDRGLCEFFIGGSASRPAQEDEVRAYPNPVTPDYYGWVTIDGLPDNALVKIVDAQGNLVRELGKAEAGSIQWDVYNMHHQRVKTGVYYVLSSSSTGGSESNVTKILVMN